MRIDPSERQIDLRMFLHYVLEDFFGLHYVSDVGLKIFAITDGEII